MYEGHWDSGVSRGEVHNGRVFMGGGFYGRKQLVVPQTRGASLMGPCTKCMNRGQSKAEIPFLSVNVPKRGKKNPFFVFLCEEILTHNVLLKVFGKSGASCRTILSIL